MAESTTTTEVRFFNQSRLVMPAKGDKPADESAWADVCGGHKDFDGAHLCQCEWEQTLEDCKAGKHVMIPITAAINASMFLAYMREGYVLEFRLTKREITVVETVLEIEPDLSKTDPPHSGTIGT